MAFQQPQRQQPRPTSFHAPSAPIQIPAAARQHSPPPDREEWVLFSPHPASDIHNRTDSTIQTDRITGRLSDFGSLETAAVSEQGHDHDPDNAETEDLDSLDDGLHAFNEPQLPIDHRGRFEQSADSIMPSHNGLGMFPGSSSPVQEQFWQHERYNPRRRRSLRRSSLQRRADSFEDDRPGQTKEDDKTQRIEQWRNEQSRAILAEIENETRRRRRRSRQSISKSQGTSQIAKSAPETKMPPPLEPSRTERLSFWERLTRRVIRDLIGIDDATLEYIFGESLPEEPKQEPSAASAIVDYAEKTMPDDEQPTTSNSTWDEKLLGRIAKELGILFNHISEHPGAFSTYLQTQDIPQYAGLPNPESRAHSSKPSGSKRASKADPKILGSDPVFAPTIGHHRRHSIMTMDPSLWGIEEEEEEARAPSPSAEAARLKREKDYWEQDLDVKMVFGFLRNRLTSSSATTSAPAPTQASSMSAQATSIAPPNQNDTLRRAALIRHHHPLVSRTSTAPSQPQPRMTRINSASSVPLSPILGRRSNRGADTESCASQSTKRSKTARSGSSRNYWDLGGSASESWSPGWGQ